MHKRPLPETHSHPFLHSHFPIFKQKLLRNNFKPLNKQTKLPTITMVRNITLTSSMKTKNTERASRKSRPNTPLTLTSIASSPSSPSIRSSPVSPMKFVISFEALSPNCAPRWTTKYMGGTRVLLKRIA
ncbi:hypothetical protein CNJ01255 [Cryptococcus deneoformans JEC21]|uniref:Uncharacterized protein n=1 Tax=Cryptococcus deneoformans (strain JEC21 / ATCC MYA-565) TaxID=214684 RepID=A0A0S2LIX0_CRYD1|nr:hypothetical protein CNJ01255 [Cryptococcus neoformans var. neoformans JEC21]ALO60905.1 hypothetical protein CNJ01255 [Cryptococcus neoformans var. neoformans JEC21]